jgi:hypothetical protein
MTIWLDNYNAITTRQLVVCFAGVLLQLKPQSITRNVFCDVICHARQIRVLQIHIQLLNDFPVL